MSTEYTNGYLASAVTPNGGGRLMYTATNTWRDQYGNRWYTNELHNICRLVVLDLNDYSPESIAAIPEWLRSKAGDAPTESGVRTLADQLEQQTRDPKPAEPKQFGARVTARCGTQTRRLRLLRFRTDSTTNAWMDEEHDFNAMAWRWSELSDVTLGWDDEGSGT